MFFIPTAAWSTAQACPCTMPTSKWSHSVDFLQPQVTHENNDILFVEVVILRGNYDPLISFVDSNDTSFENNDVRCNMQIYYKCLHAMCGWWMVCQRLALMFFNICCYVKAVTNRILNDTSCSMTLIKRKRRYRYASFASVFLDAVLVRRPYRKMSHNVFNMV